MTVNERIDELAKDANVQNAGVFGSDLPTPFTLQPKLGLGAVITFPTEYTLDNVKARIFNGKKYYFVICEMVLVDGTETTYDFYPCSIVRPGFIYKKDASGKPKFDSTIPNKGTLIDHITSFIGKTDKDVDGNITTSSTQKAMDGLKSKSFKVDSVVDYETMKWTNNKPTDELVTKQAYTLNLQ